MGRVESSVGPLWYRVGNSDVGDGNQGDIYAAEKSVGDVLLRANFGIVTPYPGTVTGARRRSCGI